MCLCSPKVLFPVFKYNLILFNIISEFEIQLLLKHSIDFLTYQKGRNSSAHIFDNYNQYLTFLITIYPAFYQREGIYRPKSAKTEGGGHKKLQSEPIKYQKLSRMLKF